MRSLRVLCSVLAISLLVAACGPSAQERADEQTAIALAALNAGDLDAAKAALAELEAIRGVEVPVIVRNRVRTREQGLDAMQRARSRQVQGRYLEARELFEQAAALDAWFAEPAATGIEEVTRAFVSQETDRLVQALAADDVFAALQSYTRAIDAAPDDAGLAEFAGDIIVAYEELQADALRAQIRSGDATEAQQQIQRFVAQIGRSTDVLDQLLAAADAAVEQAAAARRVAEERERAQQERLQRDVSQRIGCEGRSPRSEDHCDFFRAQRVSRADLGDRWPLTVSSGVLICSSLGTRQTATFLPDGSNREYALNGTAESGGWPSIRPIWADDDRPGFRGQGIKKSISPLITAALAVC